MKKKITKEFAEKILAVIDNALAEGEWSSSTFLTQIEKKLKLIRDDYEKDWNLEEENATLMQLSIKKAQERPEMIKVYILLYSAKGKDLSSWEQLLVNLPGNVVSRPVYDKEEKIIGVIRNRGNTFNDAYIEIYVYPEDMLVLTDEKIPVDKFGNALISLKNNAIKLENIESFVYVSESYHYIKGHLVPK